MLTMLLVYVGCAALATPAWLALDARTCRALGEVPFVADSKSARDILAVLMCAAVWPVFLCTSAWRAVTVQEVLAERQRKQLLAAEQARQAAEEEKKREQWRAEAPQREREEQRRFLAAFKLAWLGRRLTVEEADREIALERGSESPVSPSPVWKDQSSPCWDLWRELKEAIQDGDELWTWLAIDTGSSLLSSAEWRKEWEAYVAMSNEPPSALMAYMDPWSRLLLRPSVRMSYGGFVGMRHGLPLGLVCTWNKFPR